MRIDFDAAVVDSGDATVGQVTGVVFERESRRVAGFLVRADGSVPREVFVMSGQAARIERERVTLALTGEEFVALPDARQHFYAEPGQDLDAEIAAAEAEMGLPDTPDPDERAEPSRIPGIAFLPNMMIPIEVERAAFPEGQVALDAGLRVITADGEELGHPGGVAIDDDAQLVGLVVGGDEEVVIGYDWLDQLDEDANEVTLTVTRGELTARPAAGDAAPEGSA